MTGSEALSLWTVGAAQTRSLAQAIAPLCVAGDVLLLAGGLGAGKTTFAQGFGGALGITEPITSPTFTLVRHYAIVAAAASSCVDPGDEAADLSIGTLGLRTLVHADLYRLESLHEVADLALGELVDDGGVALVEWGNVAGPVFGAETLMITLAPADDHDDQDDRRLITVQPNGTTWRRRWRDLRRELAPWQVAP